MRNEIVRTNIGVTEAEIAAAEKLRIEGNYSSALRLSQDMLGRAQDDEMRMRLLFDVACCSTRLGLDEITHQAILELERLPEPAMSRFFIDFVQAIADIEQGQAQNALDLINKNLASEFVKRDGFLKWRYEHLAYRGRALTCLARCEEALDSLKAAHAIVPDGTREVAILGDQANCLMALDRFEEAYNAASQMLAQGDEDMKSLAMQYMAECRLGQGRAQESLAIYGDLLQRPATRWISEERIQTGIKNAMEYFEEQRHQEKPY